MIGDDEDGSAQFWGLSVCNLWPHNRKGKRSGGRPNFAVAGTITGRPQPGNYLVANVGLGASSEVPYAFFSRTITSIAATRMPSGGGISISGNSQSGMSDNSSVSSK